MSIIKLDEQPIAHHFYFSNSEEKYIYKVVIVPLKKKGFSVKFCKNGETFHRFNIDWNIPPDYQAAHELLTSFLEK